MGAKEMFGLKVKPIGGFGPNLANWAINGPIVGLESLPSVGLLF